MSGPRKAGGAPAEDSDRPVSDEAILKVAKEVVVKFIEIGQLSPQNFSKTFQEIHTAIHKAVRCPDSSP